MLSETQFAALPVRQRGTIEIIDTALKLFRRYFGVLMAWSAIIAVAGLLGSLAFASILTWPLIYGAAACCIAAAVRGQSITFGQVWDFTKPRYGALLLLLLLTGLLLFAGIMAAMFVAGIIMFGAFYLLQLVDVPVLSAALGVVGVVLAMVVGSVASVLAYAWLSMVPIIACLEDDKRGAAAMGRAWELIKGSWLRVMGLSALLTIAVVAVMGMVFAALGLFGQGLDVLLEGPTTGLLTASAALSLFFLFWNPIQTLIIAVLYLDLRVRKEALDLEWTSYASAPPPAPANNEAALPADPNGANAEMQPLSTSVFAGAQPAPHIETPRPPSPTVEVEEPTIAPPRPPAPTPVGEAAPVDAPESPSSFGAGNAGHLTAPPFDAGEGERDARA